MIIKSAHSCTGQQELKTKPKKLRFLEIFQTKILSKYFLLLKKIYIQKNRLSFVPIFHTLKSNIAFLFREKLEVQD